MRFLIDMPVTPDMVDHLGRAGHDAVHAMSIGLAEAPDQEILEVARRERRVVVTADLDYPRLLALARADGPGLILVRGGSHSDVEMLAMLDRVLAQAEQVVLERSIIVVDRSRIRRRPLPIE